MNMDAESLRVLGFIIVGALIVIAYLHFGRSKAATAAAGVQQALNDVAGHLSTIVTRAATPAAAAPAAPAPMTTVEQAGAALSAMAGRPVAGAIHNEADPDTPPPVVTIPPVTPDSVFIDRDDFMIAIGRDGVTQAVRLDGTTRHGGFGPGMDFFTQPAGGISGKPPSEQAAPISAAPAPAIVGAAPAAAAPAPAAAPAQSVPVVALGAVPLTRGTGRKYFNVEGAAAFAFNAGDTPGSIAIVEADSVPRVKRVTATVNGQPLRDWRGMEPFWLQWEFDQDPGPAYPNAAQVARGATIVVTVDGFTAPITIDLS